MFLYRDFYNLILKQYQQAIHWSITNLRLITVSDIVPTTVILLLVKLWPYHIPVANEIQYILIIHLNIWNTVNKPMHDVYK